MLTAAALVPPDENGAKELRLGDILGDLRMSFIYDKFSDFELMMGVQATVLNAAFNRLMGRALTRDALNIELLDSALRAQHSACVALNTLCHLRADYRSGKQTEEQ